MTKEGAFIKTEYLLNREVEHVLAALMPANRLVCKVSLHTGLRVSDVLTLRTEQLKPSFWVVEAKTGKKKRVGLPADLLAQLLAQAGDPWVFPGCRDASKHRTRQAVWRDLKRAATAFRLVQNIGTHSMRKVYAVRLLEKYGDIARVSRALNHSNFGVTMVYAMADKLLEQRLAKHRSQRKKTARRRA